MLVAERAKRSGDEPPPYDFFELIGKGSYGRVYKGKDRMTNGLVAIKIIDIDKVDYEEMTSKNLSETLKEISILQQLRDSKARPYVNIIEEARTVHNELWIISEYASGGSVHTLMKPTMSLQSPGLEEKYIIPIARELALGLKFVHEAGVLHRDLKCNNILIQEDGRVQLCDFGVSGTLEPDASKRSTIVGTPYWMAPELQKEWVKDFNPENHDTPNQILYGSEVDIWAYGCTLYEMATGFPPFHKVTQAKLAESGVPHLEGSKFSDGLKDLVAFVLQPNPKNRPIPDQILDHPYLANTTKLYPTVTLVQLVERYYRWEQGGGARASLFNPYGAQAPDPLAPEVEDEDDDWTFSTTDEFERQYAVEFHDPFHDPVSGQAFTGMGTAPQDEDRFAKLEAKIKEESINRGKRRLDRLFDKNSTPYRYSSVDSDRPPSDLVLRDFNPGAPNRETVIDLDFAAPTAVDIPSIDLGEVPTLKANRNRFREFELDDEETDSFNQNQMTRRATRDWKFPMAPENDEETDSFDQNQVTRRATRDWKFPMASEKPNRRTVEWTFDAAMAEANYESPPRDPQMARRRATKDLNVPTATAPVKDNRRTRDFVFPAREPAESISSLSDPEPNFSSSPTLGPGFRPIRRTTTEPIHTFSDYPTINSAPESPLRTSIIDLDMANIDDYRPTTADSATTSAFTGGTEITTGNPFDLEDQMRLSQSNDRTSYHMKSQSEPNHPTPALLTPNEENDQGYGADQASHQSGLHARGVSVQVQAEKQPANNGGHFGQRPHQPIWDGWNHAAAYDIEQSPPNSIRTDTSTEEDETADDFWDMYERQQTQQRRPNGSRLARSYTLDDDTDEYVDSYDDVPSRSLRPRVSVGPNGKPLVDFPVPRGPDPEALLLDSDPSALSNALWRATTELRDGLAASRDLLNLMKLSDPKPSQLEGFPEEEGMEDEGTVRVEKR